MREKNEIEKLIDRVYRDGGFTVSLSKGPVPKKGYVVALGNIFTGREREAYREADSLLKIIKAASPCFLGGWLDKKTGLIYFDIVEIFSNLDEALRIGKELNEIAIFNLETGEEIRIDYDESK